MFELRKINRNNVGEILNLEVYDSQRGFVTSNSIYIMSGHVTFIESEYVNILGIYKENTTLGFCDSFLC